MEDILFQTSYTLADIANAAVAFWDVLHSYRIFAFSGDLGAGKTTFIHHLCDYLHVQDAVSSPTFALINEYHFDAQGKDNLIYHLDWYRLRDTAEAINAGMEDCILQAKSGVAICFIEWPEKADDLLFKPYLWVTIETVDETHRAMTVKLVH
jgi:tRNA threonylcarbamoyladenosine biosynthesis protein TsaE